jgi:hypothetical protein
MPLLYVANKPAMFPQNVRRGEVGSNRRRFRTCALPGGASNACTNSAANTSTDRAANACADSAANTSTGTS